MCYDPGKIPGPRTAVAWMPPLPRKPPMPDDYLELGQEENPRVWIPAGIGLVIFWVLLVVATVQGKI
jgi:hypothetical protein